MIYAVRAVCTDSGKREWRLQTEGIIKKINEKSKDYGYQKSKI